MNCKMFALIICIMPAAYCAANETHVPEKNSKAYSVMVEAGAKLLEFDIIRAHVNVQEKELVADLQHEQFTSTTGKALGVLGPLEALAHGFDDVIPAFLVLQKEIKDNPINTTVVGKTQLAQALNGLVSMLASPEVLHVVLPPSELVGPAYLNAMGFLPTAKFAKTIQAIAHKKFMLQYCDENDQLVNEQKLTNDAHLFYSVVKQTVANMFAELMKTDVVATPVVNVPAKVEPKITVNEKVKQTESQDKLPKPEAKTPVKEFSCSDIEHRQDMLHQAILNDSAECIKRAVQLGSDFNQGQGDRSHLLWAVLLRKSNAIETLLELGAKDRKFTNIDLAQYCVSLGDLKSLILFAQKGGVDLKAKDWFAAPDKRSIRLPVFAMQKGDIKSAISLVKLGAYFGGYFGPRDIINPILELICIPQKDRGPCGSAIGCSATSCSNQSDVDLTLIEELIQELINNGLKADDIWNYGGTHGIWPYQQERILKIFLKNGANPNYIIKNEQQSHLFKTPILKAIEAGSKNAVQILLDAGAKIRIPDYFTNVVINNQNVPQQIEFNAIDYAIQYGNPEIVKLLIEHGA